MADNVTELDDNYNVIDGIENVDDKKEEDIVLFPDENVEPVFETPFKEATKPEEKKEVETAGEETTVIGSTTSITGDMVIDGSLELKGKIKGNITVTKNIVIKNGIVEGNIECDNISGIESTLTGDLMVKNNGIIPPNTVIVGNINAKNLQFEGNIQGNVDCSNTLDIGKAAVINGDITAANFSVENGAQINGMVHIKH